jgi:hypothetical protein
MKSSWTYLFLFLLILSSCAVSPSKFRTTDFDASYLNLSSGKWLLNYIETDLQGKARDNFKRVLSDGLSGSGCDSLYYVGELKLQYVIPSALIFNVSKETLKTLQITTDYDFLICTKARVVKNKYDNYLVPTPKSVLGRETEVVLMVYDISSGICIYSHSIVGSNSVDQDDEFLHISKNTSGLLFKSLKKVLKELKRFSGPIPLGE